MKNRQVPIRTHPRGTALNIFHGGSIVCSDASPLRQQLRTRQKIRIDHVIEPCMPGTKIRKRTHDIAEKWGERRNSWGEQSDNLPRSAGGSGGNTTQSYVILHFFEIFAQSNNTQVRSSVSSRSPERISQRMRQTIPGTHRVPEKTKKSKRTHGDATDIEKE